MSVKLFRTTSLVQNDFLCHFEFCRKGVKIEREIGRLDSSLFFAHFFLSNLIVCFHFMVADERMRNVDMIQAMKRKKAELTEQSEMASLASSEKLLWNPKKKKPLPPWTRKNIWGLGTRLLTRGPKTFQA